MPRKMTEEEFKERAKQVHGDFYDYSKTEYKNSRTKVVIRCPIHGEFQQLPNHHLRGIGCPECADDERRFNTDNFTQKSKEIHGNYYDYSKTEYKNNRTKVVITCPIHGDFEQRPDLHLEGSQCPTCAGNEEITTEQFIQEARKVHGNKYDYSKVEYKTSKSKVTIICPIHGEFEQIAYNHMIGRGCRKCYDENQGLSKEEFIERARETHGDFYDYCKTNYNTIHENVKIICPVHGEFQQLAGNHLLGNGCPECAKEKLGFWNPEFIKKHHAGKLNNPCTFYIIECYSSNEQFIKVGITSRTIEERYQNNLTIYNYKTLYEYRSTLLDCSELEQKLLKEFKDYQYEPEYKFAGSSECLTYDVLDDILILCQEEKQQNSL